MSEGSEVLHVAGREIAISNPAKVLFPQAGHTKLDLARYYLAVAEGALGGSGGRPNVLVRYPNGIDGEFFYQKRAPQSRPPWIEVVTLRFPSGRSAEEVVPRDAAALVWMANLACLELHPHPVRAEDLDHPDELRVDLDPVPGVRGSRCGASRARCEATLADFGLRGWPKTSGSRGLHVYVRIERRWTFTEVRRAALAFAREVERRAPAHGDQQVVEGGAPGRLPRLQPEREGPDDCRRLFRPSDAGRARLGAAHLGRGAVVRPARLHAGDDAARGSRRRATSTPAWTSARIRSSACSSSSDRHERDGLGDAPWPPHYRKQAGEPPRVAAVAPAPAEAPAHRGRPRRAQGRRARAARASGRRAIPKPPRTSSRPTSSSTRCAAASTRGPASASTCSTCPRPCDRHRSRSNPIPPSPAGPPTPSPPRRSRQRS